MVKLVSILLGLVMMGLGVWGAVSWWPAILAVLEAAVVVAAVLSGVGMLVFGLSEMWAGESKSAPPPAAMLPEGPGEPA